MRTITKQELARRQLGTALQLFLDDADPVSVHCLACGGSEIADTLAAQVGVVPFKQHALDTHPGLKPGELAFLKNKYWNAMKHSLSRDGKIRDDDALMSDFNDEHNDHILFVGWYDYMTAVRKTPVEAQVFQCWYFANFPEKLAKEFDVETFTDQFPRIRELRRTERKAALRRKIKWARSYRQVMQSPLTDRRRLILGRK